MESITQFQLGKLSQKFLLLEIFIFSFPITECLLFLYSLSKQSRTYLQNNKKFLRNRLEKERLQLYAETEDELKILSLYQTKFNKDCIINVHHHFSKPKIINILQSNPSLRIDKLGYEPLDTSELAKYPFKILDSTQIKSF